MLYRRDSIDDKLFANSLSKANSVQNTDEAVRQLSVRGPGSQLVSKTIEFNKGTLRQKQTAQRKLVIWVLFFTLTASPTLHYHSELTLSRTFFVYMETLWVAPSPLPYREDRV